MFVSDNGFLWGEHRWHDKQVPYEESIRVPLIVRYDPLITGSTRGPGFVVEHRLRADVRRSSPASTLRAPKAASLLPLLRRHAVPWRKDFLIEHRR